MIDPVLTHIIDLVRRTEHGYITISQAKILVERIEELESLLGTVPTLPVEVQRG